MTPAELRKIALRKNVMTRSQETPSWLKIAVQHHLRRHKERLQDSQKMGKEIYARGKSRVSMWMTCKMVAVYFGERDVEKFSESSHIYIITDEFRATVLKERYPPDPSPEEIIEQQRERARQYQRLRRQGLRGGAA